MFKLNTPRSVFVLVIGGIIFLSLGGFHDTWELVSNIGDTEVTVGIPPSLSFKETTLRNAHKVTSVRFFFKITLSAIIAWNLFTFFDRELERKFDDLHDLEEKALANKEAKELLTTIKEKAGIQRVIQPELDKPAFQQQYSDEMLKAFHDTRTLKLMSFAGYEFLGKEDQSIFYRRLEKKGNVALKVIVLDPDKNPKIVEERVNQVRFTETTYSEEALRHEINETTKAVFRLHKKHPQGRFELKRADRGIPFRLIIMDDRLFFSFYECNCHGHHSPVYEVTKPKDPNCTSLYNTFNEIFETSWANGQLMEPPKKGKQGQQNETIKKGTQTDASVTPTKPSASKVTQTEPPPSN